MKKLLILITACLSLTLLPGCQTEARVRQIKQETSAQLQDHNAMVSAIIQSKLNGWLLDQQTAGLTPTPFEVSLKQDEIARAEWGAAEGRSIEIGTLGAKRVKDALGGIWGELSLNAPAAIGQAASGNPIGAILTLIGATGAAVGVSRRHTAKVVIEKDEKREAKYKPGGSHAELEALLKSAPGILAMLRDNDTVKAAPDKPEEV